MARLCAWCRSVIDQDLNKTIHEVTNGICRNCNDKVIFQLGAPAQEYIDSLNDPIYVLDRDYRLVTANEAAQQMLNKDLSHIQDEHGGIVFDCSYAKLPSGCGNTPHCKSCTILRITQDTHNSGKTSYRIPAILRKMDDGQVINVPLHISTEKLGDVVYLRIDS